jgi:hypothetical protein
VVLVRVIGRGDPGRTLTIVLLNYGFCYGRLTAAALVNDFFLFCFAVLKLKFWN